MRLVWLELHPKVFQMTSHYLLHSVIRTHTVTLILPSITDGVTERGGRKDE